MTNKFGPKGNWIRKTIDMLHEDGFSCAGWRLNKGAIIDANKTVNRPMAYTLNWNFRGSYGHQRGGIFQEPGHTGYPNDTIFVFDPEFETFCNEQTKKLIVTKDDPNHMFMGTRFYSNEKNHEKYMQAAGKHLDIISNNDYNQWTPDSIDLENWTKWSGRPFLVTEYYTKGENSGMGNTSGTRWNVRNQKDRGLFYPNYNLALLESKNCVGWHYIKYQDNDPKAKRLDPSNIYSNKGIVSNRYVLWKSMVEKMKELNTQVYSLIEYFDSRDRFFPYEIRNV